MTNKHDTQLCLQQKFATFSVIRLTPQNAALNLKAVLLYASISTFMRFTTPVMFSFSLYNCALTNFTKKH